MEYGTTHTTVRFDGADAATFRAEFARGSRLAAVPSGMRVFAYDVAAYPFADHVRRLLAEKGLITAATAASLGSLSALHRVLAPGFMTLDEGELNEVSRRFYDTDAAFQSTFRSFLKNVVRRDVVGGDFVFQSTPTIRFHFPRQEGFNWRPRYHTDIMLGHPPQEINLWLPVAGARGSASMRIVGMEESLALLERIDFDFARLASGVQHDPELIETCARVSRPVELRYGEFLAFDPRCIHATQYNDTDWTRISLDFRVVPLTDYEAISVTYRGTGRRCMLFRRGHYYDARTSSEL